MGAASIVLGVLSVIFAFAGAFLTPVPFLGAALSFGSPVLALVGAVLGGVAYSRAKEDGAESGVPLAGLIVSIIAFFPALFVALTCGVCNSMCAAASMTPRPDGSTPFWLLDGGDFTVSPGITPPPAPDPFAVPDPGVVDPPPSDPGAPPPAFPPPPPDPIP